MSDLNDPRVFFAAERTLLAWNRTSLTLMAFGFMIERFGLFIHVIMPQYQNLLERATSFFLGIGFVILGAVVAFIAIIQYKKVLSTLKPIEIPQGYHVNIGVITNAIVAVLGMLLTVYLYFSTHYK